LSSQASTGSVLLPTFHLLVNLVIGLVLQTLDPVIFAIVVQVTHDHVANHFPNPSLPVKSHLAEKFIVLWGEVNGVAGESPVDARRVSWLCHTSGWACRRTYPKV
jgi:hypothetical protein